ncbi:hypothetical protein M419DRAFT_120647 [Trichoderma reesei RUT C-30]|uniref:Uncharacterized protein n=1 Tax=Hypocrea jecorina (strain ATCC 56765 / BCRC 32924 / NRRL 11460 / Rut C-30) TaxID=1344414 RepID=A0A024S2F3_HYPJR|nr:hypothetical protein M419DRAFT_120647 [Trichoderma reesei RUT C-30]
MPSGIELEHFAGDVALSTDTSFDSPDKVCRFDAPSPQYHPMLDDETALGSEFIMSKTRHFAAGLENLAH